MSALFLLLAVPCLVSGTVPSGTEDYCEPYRDGVIQTCHNRSPNKLDICDFATASACMGDLAGIYFYVEEPS